MSKARTPYEMTPQERQMAMELVPDHSVWHIQPDASFLIIENWHSRIRLSQLKKFFDYLTSINVDPYA